MVGVVERAVVVGAGASVPDSAGSPLIALAAVAAAAPLSESDMADWATRVAAILPAGSVLALHGDLGAGKTTIIRAFCAALAVEDLSAVTSPTFALVHEYHTALGAVLHADLYRLRNSRELDQLGWEELLTTSRVAFVEWPEQAGDRLPATTLHVHLAHVPGEPAVRRLRLECPAGS